MPASRFNFVSGNAACLRGLWWLLPAAALLLWAGGQWQIQEQQTRQAQARLQSLQLQTAPAPRIQRSAQAQRALDQHAEQVAAVVRQLNLPLPALLQALQAPADIRVALLGLEYGGKSATSGSLKLLAEAKSGADMVNYLAFLDEQTLFSNVYLQKHEIPAESKEGHFRFQLELQWQP